MQLAILSLLIASLLLGLSTSKVNAVDICIIGAGPSGIQAAYSAESKGYTVAVFEKESYIGGKTKTIEVGDEAPRPYFTGAFIHGGLKSSSLEKLFKQFNIDNLDIDYNVEFLNADGSRSKKYFPPPAQFASQAVKLLVLRAKLAKYINGPEGYLSDYPASLNQPLKDWLEQNHLSALLEILWFDTTGFGYGSQNEVPTVFTLKFLTATFLVGSLLFLYEQKSTWKVYPLQELLQEMADSLEGDVFLNSNIINVDYSNASAGGGSSDITFSVSDNPDALITIQCDATIIAFPPTAEAMVGRFVPPDSSGLEELLDQVQTHGVFSILVDDSEGHFSKDVTLALLLPQPDIPSEGLTTLYFKQQDFKGSSVIMHYIAPLGSSITNEQVLQEMLASYSAVIGRSVDESIVQDFNRWTYFPHASTESLDNGFYEKFQSFQGHYSQYYTGGLFNFETVQDSMEHAEYLIEKFF